MSKDFKQTTASEMIKKKTQPAKVTPSKVINKDDAPTSQDNYNTETKKQRVNLTLYPDTYNDLKTLASVKKTSVSALLDNLAQEYINDNQNLLSAIKQVLND